MNRAIFAAAVIMGSTASGAIGATVVMAAFSPWMHIAGGHAEYSDADRMEMAALVRRVMPDVTRERKAGRGQAVSSGKGRAWR